MASNTAGGVYKHNYTVEPSSALQCLICLEIAEDPWQHSKCGRLLCKECLEKYGRDKPCPNCRREQPQYFEDNRSMRDIMALHVGCSVNKECEWEGTVDTLENHVDACGFVLVRCRKKCMLGGTGKVMRKDLKEHLKKNCPNRDYKCIYCGEKGVYAKITRDHEMVCEKKPLPCPNAGCGDAVERQQVPEHVSKCLHTVIPCKYKGIGCDAELERKDMAAHEQDDKLHLHMALDTVTSQLDTVTSQQVTINTLQGTKDQQQAAIKSLEDITEQQQKTINSQQDATKQQLASLQSEVELLRHTVLNKVPPVTFALSKFRKKKEKNELFTSPSFYTSPNGYHLSVLVYANGRRLGNGTHVSVSINVLEGKYDAQLLWPFTGEVAVTLLNQLEDRHHHTQVIKFTTLNDVGVGKNFGKLHFIHHYDLVHHRYENIHYLKNDTLYFQVSIRVAYLKPWLECTIGD